MPLKPGSLRRLLASPLRLLQPHPSLHGAGCARSGVPHSREDKLALLPDPLIGHPFFPSCLLPSQPLRLPRRILASGSASTPGPGGHPEDLMSLDLQSCLLQPTVPTTASEILEKRKPTILPLLPALHWLPNALRLKSNP